MGIFVARFAKPIAKSVPDTISEEMRAELEQKKAGSQSRLSKGGSVKSSASSRGDGIAQRGKTKGRNC